ncbi:hypothetical protein DFH06DRAFT_1137837 [Mycena polygramma]|nr:hypothetical protein DFH06DRAFT_1137837 [Mycena polygramma]
MAGYVPSFVSELDYLRDFSLGTEFPVDHGRLQTWYLDNDGKLLKIRIIGVVAESVQLNAGALQLVLLVAPGPEYPAARSIYARQVQALKTVIERDKCLPTTSRTIDVELHWVLGKDDPLDCAIYIRIQTPDNVMIQTNVDVSIFMSNDELTDAVAGEAPLVSGEVLTIAEGALLMCVVEPFRVDSPVDADAFERMYGLISVGTSRIFRSK